MPICDVLSREQVPVYKQNPRYKEFYDVDFVDEYGSRGAWVTRWAQVGDVVFASAEGYAVYGEVIREDDHGGWVVCSVRATRTAEVFEFEINDVEVLCTNLQGFVIPDYEGILRGNRQGFKYMECLDDFLERRVARFYDEYLVGWLWYDMSAQLVQDIHMCLFGDVFDWAGNWRTDELIVGRKNYPTPSPEQIDERMREWESQTTQTQAMMRNLSLSDVSYWTSLAQIYFSLCEVHPFRDGNGRVSRSLLSLLIAEKVEGVLPKSVRNLAWSCVPRPAFRTDRAFEKARSNGDLLPLAILLHRAFCYALNEQRIVVDDLRLPAEFQGKYVRWMLSDTQRRICLV